MSATKKKNGLPHFSNIKLSAAANKDSHIGQQYIFSNITVVYDCIKVIKKCPYVN